MRAWPTHPVVYEINTWVWLGELSRKYQRPVDLATVPPAEWDSIGAYGFDAVWFMGVWERSPAGIAIAQIVRGRRLCLKHSSLLAALCPLPVQEFVAGKFHFEPPFTSFDHLVGACKQRRRHFELERFRGLRIDHQLELIRRLHR